MKRNRFFVILFACILLRGNSQEQTNAVLPIIPKPTECVIQKGNFVITSSTKIVAPFSTLQNEIEWLNEYLNKYYGFTLQRVSTIPQDNNYISFEFPDWEAKSPESYFLSISEKNISIIA